MKVLKEKHETLFSQENAALDFFETVNENSLWEVVSAGEIKAKEIPYCPIMAEEVKKTVGLSDTVSTDSVMENMDENLCLGLKYPGGFFPLGETGFLSALQRAGYMQSAALSGREEKANFRPMTPEERVIVLNIGLKTQKNKQFMLLLRDEKIRYVGSSEYVPLNFNQLMKIFRNGLAANFDAVTFAGASATHEYFSVSYDLKSDELECHFMDVLMDSGLGSDGIISIRAKLVSSDVGLSGANIYPYITVNGEERMVGRPICLEHKGEADYYSFNCNTDKIFALFKESEEKLEAMALKKVRHPADAVRKICKAAGLPKKLSLEEAEEFKSLFENPSQLDVYWTVYAIYEAAKEDGTFSMAKKLFVEETIARAIYSMDEYDLPFEWI